MVKKNNRGKWIFTLHKLNLGYIKQPQNFLNHNPQTFETPHIPLNPIQKKTKKIGCP